VTAAIVSSGLFASRFFHSIIEHGLVTASDVAFDNASIVGGPELEIEIGGTTAGTQYDRLNVTGQLALGGILNVDLASGFTLAVESSTGR
jgi:hypothetical protein